MPPLRKPIYVPYCRTRKQCDRKIKWGLHNVVMCRGDTLPSAARSTVSFGSFHSLQPKWAAHWIGICGSLFRTLLTKHSVQSSQKICSKWDSYMWARLYEHTEAAVELAVTQTYAIYIQTPQWSWQAWCSRQNQLLFQCTLSVNRKLCTVYRKRL